MPDINTVVVTPTVSVVAVNSSVPGSFGQVAEYLARVNVEEYGAVADGTTDCTTAFQNAITAAAGYRTVFIPPSLTGAKYRITGTVTFDGPVDGSGAILLIDGGRINVGTTTSGSTIRQLDVVLPEIENVTTDMTSWGTATNIGVNLTNLLESRVYVPRVTGFAKGIAVVGVGTGSVYNTITYGLIQNCKIGLYLTNGSGWANQNTFLGGQGSINSGFGTLISGTRHLLMEDSGVSTYGIPNGNTFINCGFESNQVEYGVECQGNFNMFVNCRWESSPGVLFTGAEATRNIISGGYDTQDLPVTEASSAARNILRGNNRVVEKFSGTDEYFALHNASGPALRVFPPSADPFDTASTAWTVDIEHDRIQMKATADALAKIYLDPVNGAIYFNSGALSLGADTPGLDYGTGNHLRIISGMTLGLPRHTTAEESAMTNLVDGFIYYNTSLNKLRLRANGAWETVTSA